jgi:hypothetical protein
MKTWMIGVAACGLILANGQAAVRYVRGTAPAGGDGMTWATAYSQVSAALPTVVAGDEIWVTAGNYGPIVLVNGVSIYGGFLGNETQRTQRNSSVNLTILDGGGTAEHVVLATNMNSGTLLDGFTVQNGRSRGGNPGGVDGLGGQGTGGGGIAVVGGAPKFKHCIVRNNVAGALVISSPAQNYEGFGGGVYIDGGAQPVFDSCAITGNRGEIGMASFGPLNYGGALGGGVASLYSSPTFVNCTISGNTAGQGSRYYDIPTVSSDGPGGPGANGGGAFLLGGSPVFEGCTFSSNASGLPGVGYGFGMIIASPGPAGHGGAIYASSSSFILKRCTFVQNSTPSGLNGTWNHNYALTPGTAGGSGGAIVIAGASTPILVNCVFAANTCGHGGSGGASALADRASGAGGAGGSGGAIYVDANVGAVSLTNCVLTGNVAGTGGAPGENWVGGLVGVQGASGPRGAVCMAGASAVTLSNCTVHANSAQHIVGGVSGSAIIVNSILWANSGLDGVAQASQASTAQVQYSCIAGFVGVPAGVGNTGAAPLFVDADGADNAIGTIDDNLRLRGDSLLVEAGNTSLLPADVLDLDADFNVSEALPLDVVGQPRVLDYQWVSGNSVDIGAYETSPVCVDLDNGTGTGTPDNGVDIDDLLYFLGIFEAGLPSADLDNDGDPLVGIPDGAIDINDLLFFLIRFEAGC